MSSKMQLQFTGMKEYMKRLNDMGKDIKKVSENALKASAGTVTPGIKQAISVHHLSGATEESLVKDKNVKWLGNIAEIGVGFSIRNGGLASIFLMYGTPRIKPDQSLYNSIYGSKTKRDVKKVQKEVFIKGIMR